ncbi:MAG TPA: RDD family protein [Chloroflexia bacterium]|nr:RDD family protein [Chloroflexia bacterium]
MNEDTIKNIVEYIRTNQNQKSLTEINDFLLQAGYTDNQIEQAWQSVRRDEVTIEQRPKARPKQRWRALLIDGIIIGVVLLVAVLPVYLLSIFGSLLVAPILGGYRDSFDNLGLYALPLTALGVLTLAILWHSRALCRGQTSGSARLNFQLLTINLLPPTRPKALLRALLPIIWLSLLALANTKIALGPLYLVVGLLPLVWQNSQGQNFFDRLCGLYAVSL